MIMITAAGPQLPEPLAENAAIARNHAGPCALCSSAIHRGSRYARLPSGRLAHLHCIARQPVRTPGTRRTTADTQETTRPADHRNPQGPGEHPGKQR